MHELLDLEEITLEIETPRETQRVTIPLDFSDATPFEIERVGVLTEGVSEPAQVACAFLFVAAGRQVEMSDDEWPSFRDGLASMFEGDVSVLRWEEE